MTKTELQALRPGAIVRLKGTPHIGTFTTLNPFGLAEIEGNSDVFECCRAHDEIDLVQASTDDMLREFRELVFAGIKRALEIDGHCKSYEGAVEFSGRLPNYFRVNHGQDWGFMAAGGGDEQSYKLTLHCYVLGPGRHYDWEGSDPWDVFARAMADVKKWIQELEDET